MKLLTFTRMFLSVFLICIFSVNHALSYSVGYNPSQAGYVFDPPVVYEEQEFFGETFKNTSQLSIFKLFLAMLDIKKIPRGAANNPNVLLMTVLAGGLGDYTYLHKTAKLLKEEIPDLRVSVMAHGSDMSANKVRSVFTAFYPQYLISTYAEGEELQKALDVWESAQFRLVLAAQPTSFLIDQEKMPQAFYIGEILHLRERLHTCETEACRIKQLSWIYQTANEDYKEYNNKVLGLLDEEAFDGVGFKKTDFSAEQTVLKLAKPVYVDAEYLAGDRSSCNLAQKMMWCFNAPRFGFGPRDAGILIDENIRDKVHQYQLVSDKLNTGWVQALTKAPAELLEAISGASSSPEQLQFFINGNNYYFGYFHRTNGKLTFIRSILNAHPDEPVKIVLPLESISLKSPSVVSGLLEGNVRAVRLWTPDYGWEEYLLEGGASDGRTLEIINPYPLAQDVMEALQFFSNVVVGTTGDHSLYAAISMGKLPHQEVISHQFFVRHQLGLISRQPGIKAFYSTLDPEKTGFLLQQFQQSPQEIAQFTNQLIEEHSANELLASMTRTAGSLSYQLWVFLRTIDDVADLSYDLQAAYLHTLSGDQADTARARLILKSIEGVDELVDHQREPIASVTDTQALKTFLKEQVVQIDSIQLRLILSEAIVGFINKHSI